MATKLLSGPYKGRYKKDALFCELGQALLRGEKPTAEQLLLRLDELGVPRPSSFSCDKWLPAWQDWYFDNCPKGLEPYQCSNRLTVFVPEHSQEVGDQIREKIRDQRSKEFER